MKVLYYDCFCGISGDMNLGALLDLGVDREYFLKELSKLKLDKEYRIEINEAMKKGITGIKVDVIYDEGAHEHSHLHNHDHGEGSHSHSHSHDEDMDDSFEDIKQSSEHHHRGLKEIEEIIRGSELSNRVKDLSIKMFMEVAKAESKVHGKDLYEVHFHEVGAIDSIVDLVGAAICIDYLDVDKIMASTIQLGGGYVKCAHGLMPVPAPATALILKDKPVKTGLVNFETTTPTGAAILSANVDEYSDSLDVAIKSVGYGLGTRELKVPNVLRVYLCEDDSQKLCTKQVLIETNIDDMNPELYEYVENKLFAIGALDVYKTPIIMKKGRPATMLSVLCDISTEESVLEVIFKDTTSLGVRKQVVDKIMLDRLYKTVETEYGDVGVKLAYYMDKLIKYKAEYEDCKKLAIENDVAIKDIYKLVDKAMEALLNERKI